jgi:PAS domain S-box-containing protein
MKPEQKQRIYLFLITVMVTLGVGIILLIVLYHHNFNDHRTNLIHIAKIQARTLEAVARFDAQYSSDFPGGAYEASLKQIREVHSNLNGFGNTGEFLLAKLKDDQILFILRHQHDIRRNRSPSLAPFPIAFESELAEPMRRALKGESGTLSGPDYKGEIVLAAYEPVSELNLGLVAKIDLSEIRKPFFKAGLSAGVGGLILILLGGLVFFRISDPLIRSIKENEERWRNIADNTASIIYIKNLDGVYTFINKRFEIVWGINEKEILGRTDHELFSKAVADQFVANDMAVLESRSTLEFDESAKLFGHTHAYLATKFPFLDSEGKPSAVCGISTDITDRKRKQEEFQKLSQVVQQIPISVLITNETGEIEFVNEALTKLSGYSSEEILGQTPRMFKSGESPNSYYKVLWETISQGKEWRGVFHCIPSTECGPHEFKS